MASFAGNAKTPAHAHVPPCPPRWQRQSRRRRREAASPSCPSRPTSSSVALPPSSHPSVFFSHCLTPTPVVLCLFLHKLHAVFPACKQTCTCTAHCKSRTVCARDSSPLCSAALTVTSRQLSLISVTRTSQLPPSTTDDYNPHPAPTGGDVAPSMASPPTPPPLGAV